MKKIKKINLSIIVPCYNEENGIKRTISEIFKDAKSNILRKILNSFEIIIVDDGSFDNTQNILEKMKRKYKIKIVRHISNLGLGAAILTGIENSTMDYATYLPADGQVFLREIYKGLEIAPATDFVLTYRNMRYDYNPYRHLLSNTLLISMRIFFGLSYKDYNWVHIWRTSIFKKLQVKSKGVFFLAEVVAQAHNSGLKILQVEAYSHPRSSGKSKNARLTVALITLTDLIRLWIRLRVQKILLLI